jgi:glycine/D-amino acid oxidase-like deaminating enzyme
VTSANGDSNSRLMTADIVILGEIPGIAGLYVCAGFSGMEFKISPAIGLVMSELVVDGRAKTVDVQAFRTDRFALGQPIKAEYEYVED